MLRTNISHLVKISVVGEVASPIMGKSPYRISADGHPLVLPGVGGITYNVRVGDLATVLCWKRSCCNNRRCQRR